MKRIEYKDVKINLLSLYSSLTSYSFFFPSSLDNRIAQKLGPPHRHRKRTDRRIELILRGAIKDRILSHPDFSRHKFRNSPSRFGGFNYYFYF